MRTYEFDVRAHEDQLVRLVDTLRRAPDLDDRRLHRLFVDHPKGPGQLFSKSEVIRGVRALKEQYGWSEDAIVARLRMKPVRSLSGVTPVTVLTKPHPCPGRCVFCPNDVRMPKSYLSMEPGAQRAARVRFDAFAQTWTRLKALHANGHPLDKIELIVLGGTWTHYPETYRIGFIKRCFDALNGFFDAEGVALPDVDYEALPAQVDGRHPELSYNRVVQDFWRGRPAPDDGSTWEELEAAQAENQDARLRCVGLSLETRPDEIDDRILSELRRLGATKVQIGIQSLDDAILSANARGHGVEVTKLAVRRLRQAGFKIQAHWMANLVGATPESDREDYRRLFADPAIRPDELKVYPTSLVESAELMRVYEDGGWRPYDDDELLAVVMSALSETPRYCRLSRVIRDIPGHDIVVGNSEPNFRQRAARELERQGWPARDIRAREVRNAAFMGAEFAVRYSEYATASGRESFIEAVDSDDRLAGFCRLSLPTPGQRSPRPELDGRAIIRELHVYGPVARIGTTDEGLTQHGGLGSRLLRAAEQRARAAGFQDLAVISAVGTRRYYEARGYRPYGLYHGKRLVSAAGSELEDDDVGSATSRERRIAHLQ